jgi:hypothetical protein
MKNIALALLLAITAPAFLAGCGDTESDKAKEQAREDAKALQGEFKKSQQKSY